MSPFTEDEREQRLRHLMEVYGDGLKRLCCVYLRDMGLAEDAVRRPSSRRMTTSTSCSPAKLKAPRHG